MQALTPTLFLCFARADCDIALRVAAFVERGADVRILLEEGQMKYGEDLAEKARQAQASNMALVLFSRNSLISRWPRSQWEDALVKEPAAIGMRIGFVKCDDCVPPRVLAPMFEAAALRAIKRWVRGHMPAPQTDGRLDGDLEVLGIAIADRAGAESVPDAASAERFIRAFQHDFDAVISIECGSRSAAAIAGDLASQLELRLEGDSETNLKRLQDFCAERRLLLVLHDPRLPQFSFGGRSSTLFVPGPVQEPHDDSIRGIQHKLAQAETEWNEFCRLARLGRRLTAASGRFAECYELMQRWHAAAEDRNDRAALDESARELVWILQTWGRAKEAEYLASRRASEFADQMLLQF